MNSNTNGVRRGEHDDGTAPSGDRRRVTTASDAESPPKALTIPPTVLAPRDARRPPAAREFRTMPARAERAEWVARELGGADKYTDKFVGAARLEVLLCVARGYGDGASCCGRLAVVARKEGDWRERRWRAGRYVWTWASCCGVHVEWVSFLSLERLRGAVTSRAAPLPDEVWDTSGGDVGSWRRLRTWRLATPPGAVRAAGSGRPLSR